MSYSDNSGLDGEEVFRKRSAWILPLGVMVTVFVLAAAMLLYYLAPGGADLFREPIAPTSGTTDVELILAGKHLRIPENYLEYASTRKGGTVRKIDFFARAPRMTGWSNWRSEDFTDNSPDSPIVFLTLREDSNRLSEAERLKRVYGDYLIPNSAHPGPFGLTQYGVKADTGYRGDDFYVGEGSNGPIVLRCNRQSAAVPSPNCLREELVAGKLALTYRFKRTQLAHWRHITEDIDTLVNGFLAPAH